MILFVSILVSLKMLDDWSLPFRDMHFLLLKMSANWPWLTQGEPSLHPECAVSSRDDSEAVVFLASLVWVLALIWLDVRLRISLHSPIFSCFILETNVAVASDGIYFLRVQARSPMRELKRNCSAVCELLDVKGHPFLSLSVEHRMWLRVDHNCLFSDVATEGQSLRVCGWVIISRMCDPRKQCSRIMEEGWYMWSLILERPKFESWLRHLLARWPQTSYLTSLSLCVLIEKGLIISPMSVRSCDD